MRTLSQNLSHQLTTTPHILPIDIDGEGFSTVQDIMGFDGFGITDIAADIEAVFGALPVIMLMVEQVERAFASTVPGDYGVVQRTTV